MERCDGCDIYPFLDCPYAPPCRVLSLHSTKAAATGAGLPPLFLPSSPPPPLPFPHCLCSPSFYLWALSFLRILERDSCLSLVYSTVQPILIACTLHYLPSSWCTFSYFCCLLLHHLGSIQCTSSLITYRISTKYRRTSSSDNLPS